MHRAGPSSIMATAGFRRVCVVLCVVACAEPLPHDVRRSTATDDEPRTSPNADDGNVVDEPSGRDDTATSDRPAPRDELVERYPSLGHYPSIPPSLRDALMSRAPPTTILGAAADALAPYRWPSSDDWDRAGFIDLAATPPGYVSRLPGVSSAQPASRHDLGCAGGFLEGVRTLVAPRVDVAHLEPCDADTLALTGGSRCDVDHDFGVIAIANLARLVAPAQFPAGRKLQTWRVTKRTHAALARPGALHLCTLSHVSRSRNGERFHHHMMIAGGDAEGLWIFDTTGSRGVALQRMDPRRFVRYFSVLLANNAEYEYVARSAELSCLAVLPLP